MLIGAVAERESEDSWFDSQQEKEAYVFSTCQNRLLSQLSVLLNG